MTLIIENGTGVADANSYTGLSFAKNYLSITNSASVWNAATRQAQEGSLIEATAYIEMQYSHRFLGSIEYPRVAHPAKNYLTLSQLPTDGDTLTIDQTVFTFRAADGTNEIEIGADVSSTLVNIRNKINAASIEVTSSLNLESIAITLQSTLSGEEGNGVVTTTSVPSVVLLDYATLTGGRVASPQPLSFPRINLYDRRGFPVEGIPEILKKATVEYANRAIVDDLLPDPDYDTSGRVITQKFEKLGPIEEETTYIGSAYSITRKYPFADRMLRPLLMSTGGVYR